MLLIYFEPGTRRVTYDLKKSINFNKINKKLNLLIIKDKRLILVLKLIIVINIFKRYLKIS